MKETEFIGNHNNKVIMHNEIIAAQLTIALCSVRHFHSSPELVYQNYKNYLKNLNNDNETWEKS